MAWYALLEKKFIGREGQMGAEEKKVSFLWAASTAAAANVTNTSFKSSTLSTGNNFIGMWTIGKSKQGTGGGFSQLFADLWATLYSVMYYSTYDLALF